MFRNQHIDRCLLTNKDVEQYQVFVYYMQKKKGNFPSFSSWYLPTKKNLILFMSMFLKSGIKSRHCDDATLANITGLSIKRAAVSKLDYHINSDCLFHRDKDYSPVSIAQFERISLLYFVNNCIPWVIIRSK